MTDEEMIEKFLSKNCVKICPDESRGGELRNSRVTQNKINDISNLPTGRSLSKNKKDDFCGRCGLKYAYYKYPIHTGGHRRIPEIYGEYIEEKLCIPCINELKRNAGKKRKIVLLLENLNATGLSTHDYYIAKKYLVMEREDLFNLDRGEINEMVDSLFEVSKMTKNKKVSDFLSIGVQRLRDMPIEDTINGIGVSEIDTMNGEQLSSYISKAYNIVNDSNCDVITKRKYTALLDYAEYLMFD